MPAESALSPGPLRDLTTALHELYRDAGRPGTRLVSSAIRRRDDLPDTISHEAVGIMLRGSSLVRWSKVESVVRLLAARSVAGPVDQAAMLRRFHALWLRASDDADALAQGPPRGTAATSAPPERRVELPVLRTRGGDADDPPGTAGDRATAYRVSGNGWSEGQASSAEPRRRQLSSLPDRNPGFTGRVMVLDGLDLTLRTGDGEPVVLVGQGGLGKTQLALEYAHRHRADYDLMWWVPAEQPADLRAAFRQLAGALRVGPRRSLAQMVNSVVDRLESGHERWLLVFDNVGNPDDVQAVVPTHGGDIVMTSRNPAVGSLGTALPVECFTRAESIDFLIARDSRLTEQEAEAVAARLEDLPLALAQVAALHAVTGMSLPRYLEVFEGHLAELLGQGRPDGYETTLGALVSMAVGRLRGESPVAVQLLEVLVHLGPEPVPVTLLRGGRDAQVPVALARCLADPEQLDRALVQLARFGLVGWQPDAGRVSLHRLVSLCLRQQFADRSAGCGAALAHAVLTAANPRDPDDERTWELHALIAPYTLPSGLTEAGPGPARQLVLDQIRYLYQIGDYEASCRLAEHARQVWSSGLDETTGGDDGVLVVCRHLSNALWALGRYREARELTAETLAQLRSDPRHGEDDPLTLRVARTAGYDLRLSGGYPMALALDQDTLARSLRVRGPGTADALTSELNLAVSLRQLGDFAEAYRHDSDVLAGRTALFGPDSEQARNAAVNLTWDLHGLGRYREMLEHAQDQLDRFEPRSRPAQYRALLVHRAHVVALRCRGRFREAADEGRRWHAAHVKYLGTDHELTLAMALSYVNALRSVDRLTAGRDLAVEAQEGYRRLFGWDHPVTMAASICLAGVLRSMNRTQDAQRIDERAHRDLSTALGAAHPFAVCAVNGLAGDLALDGDPAAAARMLDNVVRAASERLDTDHPVLTTCAANLATARRAAADPASLVEWHELGVEPPPA